MSRMFNSGSPLLYLMEQAMNELEKCMKNNKLTEILKNSKITVAFTANNEKVNIKIKEKLNLI